MKLLRCRYLARFKPEDPAIRSVPGGAHSIARCRTFPAQRETRSLPAEFGDDLQLIKGATEIDRRAQERDYEEHYKGELSRRLTGAVSEEFLFHKVAR